MLLKCQHLYEGGSMKAILLSLIAFGLSASPVLAACNSTDPCAPKPVKDAWQKSLALGFNKTSGNSDTTLLTLLGAVKRETDNDLVDTNAAYNLGQDSNSRNADGEKERKTTRNDTRAGASYNYKLTPDWYSGLGGQYLHDQVADISYRVTLTPTLGYFLVKNDDVSLSLEGGPGYIFEKVSGTENDFFAPRVADRFDWVISCTSKLFQKTEFLYDTTNSNNYLINSEVGVEAAISTELSLVVSLRDNYDHEPAPGKEKNDLQMITALKVSL